MQPFGIVLLQPDLESTLEQGGGGGLRIGSLRLLGLGRCGLAGAFLGCLILDGRRCDGRHTGQCVIDDELIARGGE